MSHSCGIGAESANWGGGVASAARVESPPSASACFLTRPYFNPLRSVGNWQEAVVVSCCPVRILKIGDMWFCLQRGREARTTQASHTNFSWPYIWHQWKSLIAPLRLQMLFFPLHLPFLWAQNQHQSRSCQLWTITQTWLKLILSVPGHPCWCAAAGAAGSWNGSTCGPGWGQCCHQRGGPRARDPWDCEDTHSSYRQRWWRGTFRG